MEREHPSDGEQSLRYLYLNAFFRAVVGIKKFLDHAEYAMNDVRAVDSSVLRKENTSRARADRILANSHIPKAQERCHDSRGA